LILATKDAELALDPVDVGWYLQGTEPCLKNPDICISETRTKTNDHYGAFYVWWSKAEQSQIRNYLASHSVSGRAKHLLETAIGWLERGVQEDLGPNRSSGGEIRRLFRLSGIPRPEAALGKNRDKWAWCSAFVTAAYGPGSFTFTELSDYEQACRGLEKDCHPTQVEFLRRWAEQHGKLRNASQARPGDIMIQLKNQGLASHNGVFLARHQGWTYTIEGNAGPFVNDKLESVWQQVRSMPLSRFDYERLLDRVTVVKRPSNSWRYAIRMAR
jgi:hypothetical protein